MVANSIKIFYSSCELNINLKNCSLWHKFYRLFFGGGLPRLLWPVLSFSLILIFNFYFESNMYLRRSKRKTTSTYASPSGTRRSRRDVPVPASLPPVQTQQVDVQRTSLVAAVKNVDKQPSTSTVAPASGLDPDVTLLYSREEGAPAPPQNNTPPAPMAANTGISHQLTPTFTSPNIEPIPSIHAALGAHVSQTNKNKILNGEFIDLAHLLENTTISESQEKQVVMIDGVLSTRDKTKQTINTIAKWTDAFIIYISIYSSAHSSKYQALLKYMHTVRLGATRVRGLGWKCYDEQFRLKMSMDPTKSWDIVDNELWLLYMVGNSISESIYSSAASGYKSSINKCYNFNYKGTCDRSPCNYKHVCFKCSGYHPVFLCPPWHWSGK